MIIENDRKFFLPSDFERKYNTKFRRSRSRSYQNTFQRIFNNSIQSQDNKDSFTENDDNQSYETSISKNTKNNIITYKPQDSINDLLSYKFALNYREVVNDKYN
jgi:hypothetical protein